MSANEWNAVYFEEQFGLRKDSRNSRELCDAIDRAFNLQGASASADAYSRKLARRWAEAYEKEFNSSVCDKTTDLAAGAIGDALDREMSSVEFCSYPLATISVKEAEKKQFLLVDIMHRNFTGYEALEAGDYGVYGGLGRPKRTAKVEKVLAEFFNAEDACLVRGSGTGAIRAICFATLRGGDRVIIHDAPLYSTTQTTMQAMGVSLEKVDFNDYDAVAEAVTPQTRMVYIQRSRQQMNDSYDTPELIAAVRRVSEDVLIVVDENYAVLKVDKLGSEAGGDVSTFSMFKLLGTPGIGCVAGRKDIVEEIRRQNYSGGGQVQGPEAMEVLRSLVAVPVLFGVQGESVDEIVERLNAGEVSHVKQAVKANLEERVVLVELDEPMSKEVIENAQALGALPHPVGSDSRFEVHALFYRVAKTMIDKNPIVSSYVIRINPMRTGPDTVLRVLQASIQKAKE